MTEWQPIETAPTDQRVMLGKWIFLSGKGNWVVDEGFAYRSVMFGLFRSKTFDGEYYSHWAPLPSPPKTEDGE